MKRNCTSGWAVLVGTLLAAAAVQAEEGMFLYASFQGTSTLMLEILDDDDKVIDELHLDFFAQYYDG